MVGLPWQPKGEPTVVPSDNQAPSTPAQRAPSVYITLERQFKHGPRLDARDVTAMTRTKAAQR